MPIKCYPKSLLLLLIISYNLLGCDAEKTDFPGPYDGLYEAHTILSLATEQHFPTFNIRDTLRYFRDTVNFQVTIQNGHFEKRSARLPLPEVLLDCEGDFLDLNEALEFRATACSCWCNCDPNIDCAGDPILGVYDIISSQDQLELYLRQESADTLESPSGTLYNYWIYEKHLSLTKID